MMGIGKCTYGDVTNVLLLLLCYFYALIMHSQIRAHNQASQYKTLIFIVKLSNVIIKIKRNKREMSF